ncbi:uncharacterized protein LOC143917823 [Arctopsyche grandis]|uniref:uncharacterized protein LOC143917823 n=1 Tax=Arctopsyche grandis TaxID=121162 RepID=UPI00406D6C20
MREKSEAMIAAPAAAPVPAPVAAPGPTAAPSPADEFNPLVFEKKLTQLKDTQDSISALSTWCLQKREHHKKIVASWLNVLKRAKVDQRLTLFYLANDVIQYSKRKNYEFVESWGTTLQKATPLVRDDKVKHRILRIFRIWEERQIYDEEFLTDLTGLLSVTAGKQASDVDPNDFQAMQLVNKIRQCSVLEAETDQQLKQIHDCQLPLNDADLLCSTLKERRDIDIAKQDLEEGISRLDGYVCALRKELVARDALCRLLQRAHNHYTTQRGEVKVVANAYKNFGSRVRGLKRKLDELCETLPPVGGSPVPSPPSPGEAVPSPGPDEDLELPSIIQDVSNIVNADNFSSNLLGRDMTGKGFSSFIGSGEFSFASFRNDYANSKRLPDKDANKIEVINSRPPNSVEATVDIHTLLKSLIPGKASPVTANVSDNAYRPRLTPPPPPPPLLPGLDLLTPTDSTADSVPLMCPPTSLNFYGSNIVNTNANSIDANSNSDSYNNDSGKNSRWINNSWDIQRVLSTDTPESPPRIEQLRSPPPPPIIPIPPPVSDVDHRQLLAPPPVMPQGLLQIDDVDHRQLPPLPPPHPALMQNERGRSIHNDVDHRNLISLTMGSLPPPPAPPISPWTPQNSLLDRDYRGINEEFSTLLPPPLPPMSIPPPFRKMPSHNDNVESIDMEMSDDEVLDSYDDEHSRHMRLESSMARIHGQPPPPLHSQPPPSFRKQDLSNRDKGFMHNRHSETHNNNNMHHNDKSVTRTNLVRINSSDMGDSASENEMTPNRDFPHENVQMSNMPDIFNDFAPNAMNPINPNLSQSSDSHHDMNELQNDDDWEKSEDDPESWQKHAGHINPMSSSFGRMRPMYQQRFPPANFRRPPPLLNHPSYIEESHFSPHSNNQRGGNSNFRRPWGHPRPPRRGLW